MFSRSGFSLIFLSLVILSFSGVVRAQDQVLDRVVAVVAGQVLTLSELDIKTTEMKQQLLSAQQPVPELPSLRQHVLQLWIDQQLQLNLANQWHLTVSDQAVEAALRRVAAARQMTVAQWLKAANQPEALIRADIKQQLLLMQVQQRALGSSVSVKAADLAEFKRIHQAKYFQAHVIDWWVSVPEGASEQVVDQKLKIAEHLQRQLAAGTASNFSGDVVRTDLGWRAMNALPEIFSKAIRLAVSGDVLGPIRAPNGFHVLSIVDLQKAPELNEDQVQSEVYGRALRQALPAWLKTLRAKTRVEVML